MADVRKIWHDTSCLPAEVTGQHQLMQLMQLMLCQATASATSFSTVVNPLVNALVHARWSSSICHDLFYLMVASCERERGNWTTSFHHFDMFRRPPLGPGHIIDMQTRQQLTRQMMVKPAKCPLSL